MKKMTALLLCIITILSLCACTNDPASTTDPYAIPSTTPSVSPSEAPSPEPTPEPSIEPNALPTEPSRVVTLDGEDITDRVIELWDYVNALYCNPQVDETAMRKDIITEGGIEYAPLLNQVELVNDYFTWSGRQQLFKAQQIPTGRPLFVKWYDSNIYRLWWQGNCYEPGDLVDITVLLNTEDTMLLSMKYVNLQGAVNFTNPTDADCECANFEIAYSKDSWLINNYEFAVSDPYDEGDQVGYDGDYWHWGEVSRHHEVLTADGEDIYETVKKLWNIAQHREMEYELVEELALRSEYLDYWLLDGFEETLEKYYTDAGAEQVIDDNYFVYQDGKYYKRGYYKSGVGVSGLLNVHTMEVTDDRITLQLTFELSGLDPEGCTDVVYKDFTIAKVDGEWKIDSYEFIDY